MPAEARRGNTFEHINVIVFNMYKDYITDQMIAFQVPY